MNAERSKTRDQIEAFIEEERSERLKAARLWPVWGWGLEGLGCGMAQGVTTCNRVEVEKGSKT